MAPAGEDPQISRVAAPGRLGVASDERRDRDPFSDDAPGRRSDDHLSVNVVVFVVSAMVASLVTQPRQETGSTLPRTPTLLPRQTHHAVIECPWKGRTAAQAQCSWVWLCDGNIGHGRQIATLPVAITVRRNRRRLGIRHIRGTGTSSRSGLRRDGATRETALVQYPNGRSPARR